MRKEILGVLYEKEEYVYTCKLFRERNALFSLFFLVSLCFHGTRVFYGGMLFRRWLAYSFARIEVIHRQCIQTPYLDKLQQKS